MPPKHLPYWRKPALLALSCAVFAVAPISSASNNDINNTHTSKSATHSSFFGEASSDIDSTKTLRLDIPHKVQDLAYGEFLYDYFQEKYFSAITKALIADYRLQFEHHDEQIQVLVGSLFVGYGLLNEAEKIFNNLLSHTTDPKIQEKIWFNLAEIYYKQADSEKSIRLLQTHLEIPSDNLQSQVSLLYALNYIRLNNLELAIKHLREIRNTENLSSYAYLNLGSAYSLLDQPQQAEKYLSKLLRVQGKTELIKGIKSRAALALGKHYLKNENYTAAAQAFKNIRLNGSYANTGLLGLGWAYFRSNDPTAALTPWLELTKRAPSDRAVQEAYINVPYAYESLGALQQALDGYHQANRIYTEQQSRLNQIKNQILTEDWVDQLTSSADFSFNPLDKIPGFTPPEETTSLYLYRLFATHDFNETYRNYRELQRLMQVIDHWHKQIPVFHEMIAAHVERMDRLAPEAKVMAAQAETIYKEVSEKLDVINNRLNEAFRTDDTTLTANTKQLELLERVTALEEKVNQLPDTVGYQREKDRFRVIKGLLMWDLDSTAIERRWESVKDRVFIENQLTDLENNINQVKSARARRLQRFAGFETRIESLQKRLQELYKQSQYELLRHRVYLKSLAIRHIDMKKTHVQQLQANTIYAIARIQDMAFNQHRAQKLKMLVPYLYLKFFLL
ncbi:MAG: hypothetical protein CSA49_00510 [Gammaproteobacteria bacterium]|nr:MAG: hypothetical protein CSA49_00510 [Gammaproteobacteria bacterium]